MLNELIKNNKRNNVKINKGVYLLGNYYIKKHLNFVSNEFSIILSFKILNKISEVSFYNLNQKGKNIFGISIKNNFLIIKINNDFNWNTNIKINKNTFYFIIITYNKKRKLLKLYINYDAINNKKIDEKI